MKQASTLIFKSTYRKANTLYFDYEVNDVPTQIWIALSEIPSFVELAFIETEILSSIGMCILLEIAEIVLPKHILINIPSSKKRIEFWKDVYKELGRERLYIEQRNLLLLDAEWQYSKEAEVRSMPIGFRKDVLLGFTGGKESLTAVKVLENKVPLTLFSVSPNLNYYGNKAFEVMKAFFPVLYSETNAWPVYKELCSLYDGRQYCGFDVGHLVFQSCLYADIFKYVLLGNEHSANYGNTTYQGSEINHQYVKTIALAIKMNDYIHSYITPDFSYYSPFFGYSEYQIARILFSNSKYLYLWTSCNHSTMENNFCCNCSKCCFSYILALSQTSKRYLQQFFRKDMMDNLALSRPLMDFDATKPLDCVGEKKEVWVALYSIYSVRKDVDSPTIRYFMQHIYPTIELDLPLFTAEITGEYAIPIELPEELRHTLSSEK